ncbi:MAG TPA: hypothetical protein VE715_03905 [Blastocatellia bacterium]|nr:hypothetical protein [Blastocatellia bacterium]
MLKTGSTGEIYDRILFVVAAAWNLGAAATLIFYPDFLLARLSVNDPDARLLVRSFASSVTTWGIGYALVAFDRKRFRDFAWLGAISKTIFFTVYAAAFFGRRISFAAFMPALVDLVFAILFVEFLRRTSSRETG